MQTTVHSQTLRTPCKTSIPSPCCALWRTTMHAQSRTPLSGFRNSSPTGAHLDIGVDTTGAFPRRAHGYAAALPIDDVQRSGQLSMSNALCKPASYAATAFRGQRRRRPCHCDARWCCVKAISRRLCFIAGQRQACPACKASGVQALCLTCDVL